MAIFEVYKEMSQEKDQFCLVERSIAAFICYYVMKCKKNVGTFLVFLTSQDTTGTKLSIQGLSQPFRDGWQLLVHTPLWSPLIVPRVS